MQRKVRADAGPQNVIERGFTLVELLIVVVILGVLAGIVVFAVGNLTSNAKTERVRHGEIDHRHRRRDVQGSERVVRGRHAHPRGCREPEVDSGRLHGRQLGQRDADRFEPRWLLLT